MYVKCNDDSFKMNFICSQRSLLSQNRIIIREMRLQDFLLFSTGNIIFFATVFFLPSPKCCNVVHKMCRHTYTHIGMHAYIRSEWGKVVTQFPWCMHAFSPSARLCTIISSCFSSSSRHRHHLLPQQPSLLIRIFSSFFSFYPKSSKKSERSSFPDSEHG